MTSKSTKRALLTSVLSLALCLCMLVGTTFAWFTDSVTVGGNKIQAGTLDIELWETTYNDWMDQPGDEGFAEENITESEAPIFESVLWEPGYLAYTNLTVKNVGSLAAKIQAYIVPVEEIGELAEVIDVYVGYAPFADNYDDCTVREYFAGEFVLPWGGGMNMFDSYVKNVGTLKEVIEGSVNLSLYKGQDAVIEAGDNYQICIALKMREEAGNEYQGKEAGAFDIKIVATQATVEEDSFDNQYDKNASFPVVTMSQLKDQLGDAAVKNVSVIGGRYNETVVVPSGKTFTSENGTYIPTTEWWAAALDIEAGAEVTLNGGDYMSSGQQIINVQVKGAKVTINGGTFDGSALAWNCGDSTVVINGGTFDVWTIAVTDTGATNPIIINGGNFILGNGGFTAGTNVPMIIKGGTFNQDPTAWVAEGYKAVEADGIWTVIAE